ncbi:hypothetical protein Lal_00021341 [Lupinus albus]|nr:hypothetical protein Lal_00021341 [Lupinus albus]
MSLIVNKFRKFLRNKEGFRKLHKEDAKDSIKKSKYPKDKTTCHESGKVSHMRYTCPTYLKRIEHNNKEEYQDIKPKKAYIIWDTHKEDTTSTSTSEDEESNKQCLMAQNLNSCQASEQDKCSQLAKKYLDNKMLILEHEKKICELQAFIDDLKLQNEILDLIYANCSCDFTTNLKDDESPIMDDKSIQGLGGPMTRAKAKRTKLALERLVGRTLESGQGASTNARPIHFIVQEEDLGGHDLKAAT